MKVPARGSRRRQRIVVVMALFALVIALPFASSDHEPSAQAAESTQLCGPNDANRETLTLYNGAGTLHPCISKATATLTVDKRLEDKRFRVNKIRAVNGNNTTTIKYQDGTTEELYHVTFESFNIHSHSRLTVTPPAGGPGYSLTLTPDSAATIGGEGINTDLWVTGDSTVTLPNPLLFGICTAFKVSTFATLSWLLNGSSWDGCALNMDVRFLAVYKPGGTTTGTFPLRLPNTSVEVTPK